MEQQKFSKKKKKKEYLLNKRPSKVEVETKYIFIIRWKYLLEIGDYKF